MKSCLSPCQNQLFHDDRMNSKRFNVSQRVCVIQLSLATSPVLKGYGIIKAFLKILSKTFLTHKTNLNRIAAPPPIHFVLTNYGFIFFVVFFLYFFYTQIASFTWTKCSGESFVPYLIQVLNYILITFSTASFIYLEGLVNKLDTASG